MKNNLKNIAVTINSTGFFISLMCLLVAYPSFYTDVIAPSDAKRGFFNAMFVLGGIVATIAMIFFTTVLKKLKSSANKNVPVIIFGCLIALLSIATPYGLSITIGEKANWLTPTIAGNGLLFAYVAYLFAMGFAGGSAVFVMRKLIELTKTSVLPMAITGAITFISIGLIVVLPMKVTYEKVFLICGIATTLCATIATIIELADRNKT